jgi:hypothetical protein
MSRDEGFAVADMATAKHTDPKFKALWRYLRDEVAMNAATVLYEAVQLASWQHGERVTAEDAAPVWMSDVEAPSKALTHVGLLDAESRIPEHAWTAWFGPAVERRRNLREKWAKANRNRRNPKGDTEDTPRTPRGNNGVTAAPVRPSVIQSDRTVTPFPAPRGEEGGSNDPTTYAGKPLAAVNPALEPWTRARAD